MRLHLTYVTCLIILAATSSSTMASDTIDANVNSPDETVCIKHQAEFHNGITVAERRTAMAREIQSYQSLVEETLSQRAEAIQFHQALKAKASKKEPLSGADLQTMNQGATSFLARREALLNIAIQHECWTHRPPSADAQEAAIQVAGVAMSLSAALVLYDNYLSVIAPFRNDYALRQFLNRADKGFNRHTGTLNEIALSFSSTENRQRVRQAIDWLQQYNAQADVAPIAGYRYVQALIEQSPSLAMVRAALPVKDMFSGIHFLSSFAIDKLFTLKDESTNFSSLLFGNTVGLVEVRRGKLYQQADVASHVAQTLRAGDILVEKTPFRLTDTFIPGHWGHAAIWIGTEAELRELGIWDHPLVQAQKAAIRSGHGVVEALRSGVEINTLEHFLNIDDLGVLRHTTISNEKRAAVILLTLRQIGKSYDFNFDAETTNRIFCSKLVYLAYGDLQWPTSRILGRVTVSPDNIASRAFGDGPLSVVLLYHDGQEITDSPRDYMQHLQQPAKLALGNNVR